MKVSAFTFMRNATSMGYPYIESIKSILPIVDEFIVNIGKSEDDTLKQVRAIGDPKIKIIESAWNENIRDKGFICAQQTMIALYNCTGDWAISLQADEVIHESDLKHLRRNMEKYQSDPRVEAMYSDYYHFYGSSDYIGKSPPFYGKEIRVLRNNKRWIVPSDAQFFLIMKSNRKGRYPNAINSGVNIYHYGNCRSTEYVKKKIQIFSKYWGNDNPETSFVYDIDPDALTVFDGAHPAVMGDWIRDKSEKNFKLNFAHKKTVTERRHHIGRIIQKSFGINFTKKHFKLVK